ncbi:DEAD/DEAH box helicase [Sporosarcina sp. CAU 1771]
MSFLNELDEVFQRKWKFEHELPIQTQMIPEMLAGKDVVAESPTGTGKTLAYVLPILQMVDGNKKQTQALIVTPSQELSMQIVNVIREWIVGTPITVTQLIGGANINRQLDQLKKKPTIVVGTPGRLAELVKVKKLKMKDIKHIILDEGDQLLAREHRSGVKNLIDTAHPERQVAVVSATITPEIDEVAIQVMNDPLRIQLSAEDIPNQGKVIHSYVKTDIRDKTDLLRGISHLKGLRALAFINNVDQLRMREMKLTYNKSPIVVLHSDMKKFERQEAIENFRKGDVKVLIATDLAARGLDIQGLTHVIHVDVPHTVEQYLHRSGRTGRAGNDGEVLTFLSYTEERDYRKLTKGIKPVQKIWQGGKLMEKPATSPKSRNPKKR